MCANYGIPHKLMAFIGYHISYGMTEEGAGYK
jgi:hypothetical protein